MSVVVRVFACLDPMIHLTAFRFDLSQLVVAFIHVPEGKARARRFFGHDLVIMDSRVRNQ
jgi:hypothetical protein